MNLKQSVFPLLFSLCIWAAYPINLPGQTPCGPSYTRIIAEGDAFLKQGKYKEAFEKYRAARGCTEAEHQVLDQKTADVLRAVDGERKKADESAALARRSQKRAEAVLNKIYFYQDRFGLAYEQGKYGFIDKSLRTRISFRYYEAMPFDYTGFAWAKRLEDGQKQLQFVIDTLGNEYPLAYDVADLTDSTTALDLRNRDLDALPTEVFRHSQLKILMLAGNQLNTLPPEIGNLKGLIFLGLSRNQLTQLPPEIGVLENLQTLQVFENQLSQLPIQLGALKNLKVLSLDKEMLERVGQERIRALLPHCAISFFGSD